MTILNQLGITVGKGKKGDTLFDELFPNFLDLKYKTPSEYVSKYWELFKSHKNYDSNLNGKIFEYILATILIRENFLPLYLSAKVAFVPNVTFDIMVYTAQNGPICFSAKTSLRERYKQADLEAIALKYVHRKSLSYLLTLEENEAKSVKRKIQTGDVIGINDVIVANCSEFDDLIKDLKKLKLSDPPTVKVIESNQIITADKLKLIKKK
ncbi:MAG TPA: hypothetical protein PL056_10945 [bacterium]|nr:hypothetical protein [bacterium]